MDKNNIVRSAISTFDKYCDGYGNPGTIGNGYYLGMVLGCGVADYSLSHEGSRMLDEIDAFDKAEVGQTTIGQINMTIVSSFCGIHGLIWGLDVVQTKDVRKRLDYGPKEVVFQSGELIQIFSIDPIAQATKALFGTVENKKYPLVPGGHVPCASKNIKFHEPCRLYASIAIGIPKDRNSNACLLMEDVGRWKSGMTQDELTLRKSTVVEKLAKSILQIGKNQKVEYKEIFIGVTDVELEANQVGCALVAAPYFVIAKNAIPEGNPENILSMNLEQWIAANEKYN